MLCLIPLQQNVHQAIIDKKSDGQSAPAEKPRKRGRWDMQQTPDVNAPPKKKSAWDEVSPRKSHLSHACMIICRYCWADVNRFYT